MKSHLVLLCAIFFNALTMAKEPHFFPINPNGKTTISGVVGNTTLVAVFETTTIDVNRKDRVPRIPQCTYSRFPCSVTRQLKLSVNNAEVFVPRSVYSELGDVQSAELSGKGGFFFLTIKGGDASESYILRIKFKARLLESRLYSGGDPDHPLQSTDYYDVTTSD